MIFNYKIIFSNGEVNEKAVNINTSDFEDLCTDLYGIYIDYRDPEYANETHLISFDGNFMEMDESDFAFVGEKVRDRQDYNEILKHLKDEYSENFYYKDFMSDFGFAEE